MIDNWMKQHSRYPTIHEIIDFSSRKGNPIRGKYAKLGEYRFKEMQVERSTGPSPPALNTVRDTSKFYLYRGTGTVGELSRRSLPCFCSQCVASGCKSSVGCGNTHYCREWEKYTITPKSSQSSQQ
uniref:Uncharacterized protein n=2 Tax=Eutreptiella gymnastica TaxID=73025 RepID=A0A7S1I4J8_9EUGL|mmetsp:Transcript_129869/g.224515  ORF Transcript_129869/g.224515 Transcript_129869/m.224515 type:complete len:126 (+) Transcript_129869:675-1052(+)